VNGRPVRTSVTLTRYAVAAKYDTQVLLKPVDRRHLPRLCPVGSSIEDGSYREVLRGEKADITVSYGGLNGVVDTGGGPGNRLWDHPSDPLIVPGAPQSGDEPDAEERRQFELHAAVD